MYATLRPLSVVLTLLLLALDGLVLGNVFAAGTVGTGTPKSCTEAALDAALASGGLVIFDCGPDPATVTITSTKTIAADTTIDGGGRITIRGGYAVRVFVVQSGVSFNARYLTIAGGSVNPGGAITNFGNARLRNCAITGNSADEGGGIYNYDDGTLTVTNCTLSGNSASNGAGIFNRGTATLDNCTLSDNAAGEGGGIVDLGTAALDNCTLSGNAAGDFGGGISNYGTLTVTNCTLSGNTANWGGGIHNRGTATLDKCTMDGNSSRGDGGGIYNETTATLTDCTLSGNSAAANGGGIYNVVSPGGQLILGRNSADSGGGIYNRGTLGTTTLTNCTLSGNSASNGGGISNGGTLTLRHTIVANSPSGGDCTGPASDGGHNLQWPGTDCGETHSDRLDPLLDPLANNGGPTQTIALLPGSPAINAGDPEVCANPPVNGARPARLCAAGHGHTQCSIGAYEADSPAAARACVGDCDGTPQRHHRRAHHAGEHRPRHRPSVGVPAWRSERRRRSTSP